MTLEQAAKTLGVCAMTVLRAIRAGKVDPENRTVV